MNAQQTKRYQTMPKILLVMPKHREGDKTFPFGVATVYCTLKDKGYDVDFIDCVLEDKELDALITPSSLQQYDIIGIGGLISCYKRVKETIVPFIKKHAPNTLIMIGGYLGISIPDRLLKSGLCDVVFLGDAEESLPEFLKCYGDRSRWKDIVGIAYLEIGGSLVNTGIRTLKDLGAVYVPYYKYIDIERYNNHLSNRQRYYPLVAEVGCPFRCNFCFNSMGNNPRGRSPESVIEEIKIAMERHRPREIFMMAENLLAKHQWIQRFCKLMDENNLHFRWGVAGHANTINEDILKLVKRHGCYRIGIGFENFSQKILNNMNKHVKVETYAKVLRLLRKHNLSYSGTMIFGYFGEDNTTINENIEFCKKMFYQPTYYWIQAYPLTKLYDQCRELNIITDEENYLKQLGDNTEFVINLTSFSNDELIAKRNLLHNSITINIWDPRIHYRFWKLFGTSHYIHSGLSAINSKSRKLLNRILLR